MCSYCGMQNVYESVTVWFQCKTELNEQKAAFANMKRKWEFVESQYQAEIDAKERKVSYP